MSRHTHYLPSAGRLLISAIFLLSGFGKLTSAAATKGYIASAGLPLPDVAYLVAVAVELGGGLLLLFGYKTRAVALVLAVFTIATALAFHFQLADQMQMIHFLKNLAIAGGLLQIVAFGAGTFSIDGRRSIKAASSS